MLEIPIVESTTMKVREGAIIIVNRKKNKFRVGENK